MQRISGNGDRLAIADVPTNMLCGLVLLAAELQVDSDSWLAGLRLSPEQLADPSTRISWRQAVDTLRRALPTLPGDGIGLMLGGSQNGGNFGLLGLAMKTARTFGDAVRIGLEYQRSLGPLMTLTLEDSHDGSLAIVASTPDAADDLLPFLCEEMFASLLMLARELAGEGFRPLRMEFGYPQPACVDRYRALFRCDLAFAQPRHAMLLDARWMQLPFSSYNPVTSQQALSLCQAQLSTLAARGEVTAAVERQLRQRLRDNPSMSEIANTLHLGERTLRRQLAEEGTSFSQVHDRVRTEQALELLQDTGLTIAAVGWLLGFHDAREFRRAFKRWTGQTPSETRLRLA